MASLALHLAAFAYIASATAQFEFDFELTLPAEVEFGSDGRDGLRRSRIRRCPSRAATSPEEPSPQSDALIVDAGVPEAEPEPPRTTRASQAPEEKATDARTALDRRGSRSGQPARRGRRPEHRGPFSLASWRPAGPPHRHEARAGVAPGARRHQLLAGSPRLAAHSLEAPASTPSRISTGSWWRRPICSARSSCSPDDIAETRRSRARASRASLARAARTVRWQQRDGVPTAPWYNRDSTPRTIGLLSTHHFSITRRQDLERVLALAKARELRDAEREGLVVARGPDALLSMGPGEALSLEVEGVHRFVVGSVKHVPERLRVAVSETGADQATVSVLATYASAERGKRGVGLLEEGRARSIRSSSS